jgi:hypothetical protein
MKHYLYTEAGGHALNEDFAVLRPHPSDADQLIGALADGQGGRSGGAQAARIAVLTCLRNAEASSPADLADPFTWVRICERADEAVSVDSEAGFTTLIGLSVTGSSIVGASSGDSAVALWMDQRLVLLSQGQRKNPPVGSGSAHVTPFSALVRPPWRVLVASDGVWKYVGWTRISERLASDSAEGLADAMRADALGNSTMGLSDDFTMIIIESQP